MKGITTILLLVLCVVLSACTPRYVSPSGSDSNLATETSPVKTISKCIDIAEDQDVCILKDGIYTSQAVYDKTGKGVAVVPQTEGNVAIAFLDLKRSSTLLFQDLNIQGLYLEGNNSIKFSSNDLGPRHGSALIKIQNSNQSNLIFDGNYIHDNTISDDTHAECMYVSGTTGLQVVNNTFQRCTYFDIFFTNCCPAGDFNKNTNALIENNILCRSTAGPLGAAYFVISRNTEHEVPLSSTVQIKNNKYQLGLDIGGATASGNTAATSTQCP